MFSCVLDVLRVSGGAEVGEAIVEAIVVVMVGEKAWGRGEDEVMHPDKLVGTAVADIESGAGVPGAV